MVHFLNGKLVGEEGLRISPRDLGFTRGYAVFDFFVTYGGTPFMLERHVDRLFCSAEAIGLAVPWTQEQVRAWVLETLAANTDGAEKGVRMIVSGGVGEGLFPLGEPTIAIIVDSRHFLPAAYYANGVGITTVKYTRYAPGAKTNHYIEGVRQAAIARRVGAFEPVYYDDHQVFEGAASNVFAVIDGRLLTPKLNVLQGVTRDVLLDVLQLDIPVAVEDFSIDAFRGARELFFTGSNKEVLPITRVDGAPVGDGSVGPVTKEVMRQFQAFVAEGREVD